MASALVRYPNKGEEIPVIGLMPPGFFRKPDKQVVIWIDPSGKQSLFGEEGNPKPEIVRLLDGGMAVVGVDLFGQGEFTPDGKPLEKNRLDPDRGQYAGYTYGYNHPLFSKRVHDVLTVIGWLRGREALSGAKIHLAGLNDAGHWVAAARAQAGDAIERAVVDTGGFRFAGLTDFADADFLPGGAKYLDLPGMLALSAPGGLWLGGEGPEPPAVVAAAYRAAGSASNLTVFEGDTSAQASAAAAWLLRP